MFTLSAVTETAVINHCNMLRSYYHLQIVYLGRQKQNRGMNYAANQRTNHYHLQEYVDSEKNTLAKS